MARIAVALSGGVDSAVTAALLKRQGHDVFGLTMKLLASEESLVKTEAAAREVAHFIDIPLHIVDLSEVFAREVIGDFCHAYARGMTPNPCIRCNYYVKFGALLRHAQQMGADYLATGHYARIEHMAEVSVLRKGVDSKKEQSYFLYRLRQDQLEHLLMPLGDLTKVETRSIARRMGLEVSLQKESQDICFISSANYREFISARFPALGEPGPFLNPQGTVIGQHRGIINYTIGQRRGLGIAAGEPLYVLEIDPDMNSIVVGPGEQLERMGLVADDLNWIDAAGPMQSIRVDAKIRYSHRSAKATLTPLSGEEIHLVFDEPQSAVTPGQSVVFYEGDRVIGGGTIAQSLPGQ